MSAKWAARITLVALYAVCLALTLGLGQDDTFNGLPLVAQFFLIIAAVISGIGTVVVLGGGLAWLLGKAFPR